MRTFIGYADVDSIPKFNSNPDASDHPNIDNFGCYYVFDNFRKWRVEWTNQLTFAVLRRFGFRSCIHQFMVR